MTDPHPVKRAAFEPAERLLRPTGYNPDMKRPPTGGLAAAGEGFREGSACGGRGVGGFLGLAGAQGVEDAPFAGAAA